MANKVLYSSLKYLDSEGWLEMGVISKVTGFNLYNYQYDSEGNQGRFEPISGNTFIKNFEDAKFEFKLFNNDYKQYREVIMESYIEVVKEKYPMEFNVIENSLEAEQNLENERTLNLSILNKNNK